MPYDEDGSAAAPQHSVSDLLLVMGGYEFEPKKIKDAVASVIQRVVGDGALARLLELRPYVTDVYGAFLTKSLDGLLDAVWSTVFHEENDALERLSLRLQESVPEPFKKYAEFNDTQQLCRNGSDLLFFACLVPVFLVLVFSVLLIATRKTWCFALSVACTGVVGVVLSAVCMALTLASLPNGTVQNEAKLLSRDAVATADELMERYLHDNVTATVDLSEFQTEYVKFSPERLVLSFSTLSELIDQFRLTVRIDLGPLAQKFVDKIPRLAASSEFSVTLGTTRDKFSSVFNSKSSQRLGELFNQDKYVDLASSLIDGLDEVVQNISDIQQYASKLQVDSYFQNLSESVDPVIEDMGIDSEGVAQDILAAMDIEPTYCDIN